MSDQLIMDMWRTGPPPASGQRQRYPGRFWYNFKKHYPTEGKKILHMFSGSLDWADTTDIRPETGAKIVAPYDKLPIPDETYDMVIADPPYSKGFSNTWTTHKNDLPQPKRILIEASRVTKQGGIIAILHIITIPQHKEANVRCIGRHGILCGPNNAIRLLNVFRKKTIYDPDYNPFYPCPKCGYLCGEKTIYSCETFRCPKCGTIFEPEEGAI